MKNNNLFVVFHREAASPKTLEILEQDIFSAVPGAALCYKPYMPNDGRPAPIRHCHMINGRDLQQAVNTICEKAGDRRVVLVTLCAEMQRAASGRDFTLLTVGPPADNTDFNRAIYASHPSHVGTHLQKLVR